MAGIRVLVVDDSVVIRKVLVEALSADPEIEVVGTAPDGNIALSKIAALHPDLVTLDVEMPGMTGIETLVEIRKSNPKLPVIMFSTLTEKGAMTTLEALSLGASDCVTKPQNSGSVDQTRTRIRSELIPKVKELCRRKSSGSLLPFPAAGAKSAFPAIRRNIPADRVEVVAIGTSTGGPNALSEVFPMLSKEFPVPIVLVQHMPPIFTRLLAERLGKRASISIREGADGEVLTPGCVWIAPGDFHMRVARGAGGVRLVMSQDPPQCSCRPSVDVLFESVAEVYGANVLAVVLTGMGSDGSRGSERIHAAGGQVIVQDEATSVVWGMPGQVAAAGLADGIFPLAQIAGEMGRRTHRQKAPMGSQMPVTFEENKTGGHASLTMSLPHHDKRS